MVGGRAALLATEVVVDTAHRAMVAADIPLRAVAAPVIQAEVVGAAATRAAAVVAGTPATAIAKDWR